jgi:osmotically-inducible protein OsmY
MLIAVGMQSLALLPLQAADKTELTDTAITAAVEGGFEMDRGILPNDVDVSTSQGIVSLSGSVDNILAKERAVMAAASIKGVRGVIDTVTVTPVSRSDEDLLTDIQAALKQDPATESYKTSVSVQDADVTLTGSVGSYAEKRLATRIASGVKGVKEVANQLTINYLAPRTDAEIAADVQARLQWDVWINGGMIKSTVNDGGVILTGTIGSVIGKSRAFDDAWVNGAMSVDDSGLKVEPLANGNVRKQSDSDSTSDGDIQKAVQASLQLDPRVSAFSPNVTVEGGVVILGGSVGNLKAKTSAGQDAKNVMGVYLVDNFLKVRPEQKSTDKEMQSQLKAALFWDPLLDSSTIDVAVINHVAYLSGGVDSSFQKVETQDVASKINGVELVRNHLKVEPEDSFAEYGNDQYRDDESGYYGDYGFSGFYGWPNSYYYNEPSSYSSESVGPQPYKTDAQIKKSIEDRFFWSPFVDRDDIKVTIDGGVATLTGSVGTWIGYGEADKDAHKGGAATVLNRITVSKGHWL